METTNKNLKVKLYWCGIPQTKFVEIPDEVTYYEYKDIIKYIFKHGAINNNKYDSTVFYDMRTIL